MVKRILSAAAVVLTLCLVCGGFFSQPPDKFDDNNLLTCYISNPYFATGRGQPARIAEEPPTIALQQLEFDEVWLPVSSGYPLPHVRPKDVRLLAEFLGNDLDTDRQALEEPDREAPDPCPTDSNSDTNVDEFLENLPVTTDARVCFQEYFMRTACQLNFTWTPLPKTFFPQWFSGGFCPPSNCSVPFGAFCAPNVSSNTTLYTVLRWDCCWSLQENNAWVWDCGWRKVRFPAVCDCDCGCGARGYSSSIQK